MLNEITKKEFEERYPEVSTYGLEAYSPVYLENGVVLIDKEWNGEVYTVKDEEGKRKNIQTSAGARRSGRRRRSFTVENNWLRRRVLEKKNPGRQQPCWGSLFCTNLTQPTGSVQLVQRYPKTTPVIFWSLSILISLMTERQSVRFSSRVKVS